MTRQNDAGSIADQGFAKKVAPIGTIGEHISQKRASGTSYLGRSRFGSKLIAPTINNNFQQNISMGTYSKGVVREIPSTADAFLDIEIEQAVREAIDVLSALYAFRESSQVRQFLSSNNTLRGMLSVIYSKIRKEFPSEKIILEVVSDSPNSGEKDIVVSVTTSLPVDEAIERLDKVEDTRWNKDSPDPYVDICVKLEYQ